MKRKGVWSPWGLSKKTNIKFYIHRPRILPSRKQFVVNFQWAYDLDAPGLGLVPHRARLGRRLQHFDDDANVVATHPMDREGSHHLHRILRLWVLSFVSTRKDSFQRRITTSPTNSYKKNQSESITLMGPTMIIHNIIQTHNNVQLDWQCPTWYSLIFSRNIPWNIVGPTKHGYESEQFYVRCSIPDIIYRDSCLKQYNQLKL